MVLLCRNGTTGSEAKDAPETAMKRKWRLWRDDVVWETRRLWRDTVAEVQAGIQDSAYVRRVAKYWGTPSTPEAPEVELQVRW
jgi:hypothetical protein